MDCHERVDHLPGCHPHLPAVGLILTAIRAADELGADHLVRFRDVTQATMPALAAAVTTCIAARRHAFSLRHQLAFSHLHLVVKGVQSPAGSHTAGISRFLGTVGVSPRWR